MLGYITQQDLSQYPAKSVFFMMGSESLDYVPLVSPDDDPYSTRKIRGIRSKWREKIHIGIILLQACVLVFLLFINLRGANCQPIYVDRPLLYSPAQEALENEVKVFTVGREEKTIYQGFDNEADRAWGDLYNHTLLKISRNEAALLPNKTYPIYGEGGYYLAGLDVFHQLHCLHVVRHALYSDQFDDPHADPEHVSHCIDAIRQSLMCNADISVNVWQWSQELSAVVGYSSQAHSCRNFDKLRDWARERRIHEWIDIRLFVEDDLPDPPIIS
ncbi:uncharacterized protein BT62DRAFT_951836 [Guyanagaster necrorhizus]|uniref:Cyclochlorotine biosynthesis protein O n=1 Tax=Guyanagaster necrorhizus TaxID=856835 RepID=A0A9P7VQ80_9AGAR|nr:uncharacterized protein BT62DRAFT_951836 [Guyanagaster necrorhizus MCA 3950]KAG7444782.1 hypothetical protein BT62DRAFT_951836 [Guyanagaster necrorhizus MCA 3950]